MRQVAVWLQELGLGQYAQRFAENGIDFSVLPDLTDQDLEKLGVLLGHRRRMQRAISKLNDGEKDSPQLAETAFNGPLAHGAGERRQVTVMFSDVVGSAALSARMDPEDLREVISAYQKCVAVTVRRFGGFVAQYMGDGALIYFGYPQAHEYDAEQAIRAGLELVKAVSALKTHATLQTRVGIATGLVVVGDPIGSGDAQERAVGEMPNLAARLQSIAGPNTVVIAESTRKLVGNLFQLEDLGAKDLRGISGPVRAWAALSTSGIESRFEALHASGLTELIGREEELELLVRRWSKAKTGEGQVVLLSGEPGIGKSRLTAALLEHLAAEPHTRLRYFCSPQHTDSTLYPIISQMKRAAGFAHDDTAHAMLDKLDALLAQSFTPQPDAALIADMLSFPNDGRYLKLDLTPQKRRQRTFEALTSQIASLADQRPVLMIFEDVHWIDATSLEALGRVIGRIKSIGVLLIITHRTEFDPPWIGLPYVTALGLKRLGEREIGAMIDCVAGNKALPKGIRQDIIERTDGIPLFIEEMTRAVLEAENEGKSQRTAAAIPSSTVAVPASLHASLMARLDRLGAAKEMAQIGAAIGREFSHNLLTAVARKPEAEIASALDRVIAARLLLRQGTPPQATYLFKHALVQDAAYGTLLREPRRALHARVAETIEDRFPEIAQNQPEILAHHFTEAGRPERSVNYWLRAGKNAAARSANVEAISHLRQGIKGVSGFPEEVGKDRLELDLQFALGPCLIATQGASSEETMTTIARARELCRRIGDPAEYPQIMHWLTVMHAQRGELLEALDAATAAVGLAEARGHRPAVINATRGQGLILLMLGRLLEAQTVIERNVAEFEACDEVERLATRAAGQDAGVAGLAVMAWVLWALGYVDLAAARMAAAMQRADTTGHPHTQAYASYYASVFHALRREPEIAYSHAERCVALSEEHGFGHWRNLSSAVRWSCAYLRDSSAGSLPTAHREFGSDAGAEYQLGITALYVLLAEALVKKGELGIGIEVISKGLATADRTSERIFQGELLRLQAQALMANGTVGAVADAQIALEKALATTRSQHAHSLELRAAMRMARLWRDQGKPQQAREVLATVYGWFTEGFDTLDLKEAGVLLKELAS